jgi:hypothetical protein
MEDQYAWTCGGDKRLVCKRLIDTGAYGTEVYEVKITRF